MAGDVGGYPGVRQPKRLRIGRRSPRRIRRWPANAAAAEARTQRGLRVASDVERGLAAGIAQRGDVAIQGAGSRAAPSKAGRAAVFPAARFRGPIGRDARRRHASECARREECAPRFPPRAARRPVVGDFLRMIAVVIPGRFEKGVERHCRLPSPSISTSASISTGIRRQLGHADGRPRMRAALRTVEFEDQVGEAVDHRRLRGETLAPN